MIKDLVLMTICFFVFLFSLILMNGMFKYSRMELKKCKWNGYPKKKPKMSDGDNTGNKKIRLMISRKNGIVCFDEYDMESQSFNYDDVDAWKSVPMCYKAYKKMVFKCWDKIRRNKSENK